MSFWGRNWWVVLFCVATLSAHFHFIKEKKNTVRILNDRMVEMERALLQAVQYKEELELRIASQSDPAWIEMVLIRQLGVVPEGFFKVHFKR